jgi:hypothetical protein
VTWHHGQNLAITGEVDLGIVDDASG